MELLGRWIRRLQSLFLSVSGAATTPPSEILTLSPTDTDGGARCEIVRKEPSSMRTVTRYAVRFSEAPSRLVTSATRITSTLPHFAQGAFALAPCSSGWPASTFARSSASGVAARPFFVSAATLGSVIRASARLNTTSAATNPSRPDCRARRRTDVCISKPWSQRPCQKKCYLHNNGLRDNQGTARNLRLSPSPDARSRAGCWYQGIAASPRPDASDAVRGERIQLPSERQALGRLVR